MLHLALMRHGKSSWKMPLPSDHDRTLKKRGLRQSRWVARRLLDDAWSCERLLVSSARRAQETAEVLLKAGHEPTFRHDLQDLYHANATQTVTVIRRFAHADERVMVVGHEPGLSATVLQLTGAPVDLKTADCALLASDASEWALATDTRWSLIDLISAPRLT